MAIRGNPPLDDWLNNFDRVLEEKYQWAPPATVSNSQLPSRMANPTVLSSADFIAKLADLARGRNLPISIYDADVWDLYDHCSDLTKKAIIEADGIARFIAKHAEFLVFDNQFQLHRQNYQQPLGLGPMSSAYLSPFLSTNISQPEFRPRLGYPHEPMPLRMLPTLTQKIVHGVIQMSRPKYGLAQSKLADTLIFFTPLSLDLELPEACAIPPISDLLIKGDTVELLIIPQPEEEGIRWFAERVRKIPFSSSSLPLVAAKRNETLNDLESLEPPFFNGTYGARKQRLDDDGAWCFVGQKSAKAKDQAWSVPSTLGYRDESVSHCSTSSLVSDNNYIPVGLTGEAARSLLGTSNHAAPTKAGKKNRKRRAKQKSNSTEKHSINDDSIYNGHLSQESNVEETQYIEESNPIFTDQQPPSSPIVKSVSLGSLSTHTPDTWEDNLLLLDSICEVPVLTSAVAQIAKKSGCTSGLSTISNGDTSQNMLLTNGNDDVLESLKKRLECLSFTKSKTIKGKSPTYCHPAYCDDENAAAVSGFDETFRRLCYVIKEMEMAK